MPGLYRDQVGEAVLFAKGHRLAVAGQGIDVATVAPGHGAKVVEGVGHGVGIVQLSRGGERLVKTFGRGVVGVGTPVGHAELVEQVTHPDGVIERARLLDGVAKRRHGRRRLPVLGMHRAAQGVQGDQLGRVDRVRVW